MPRSFQTPPSEPLPEAIFVELVDMLFVTVQPVVALGVVILVIGGGIAVAKDDAVVAAATIACGLITPVRVMSMLAYRRRVAAGPLNGGEARVWARRYAFGGLAMAAAVGALSARVLVMDDALLGMLALGLLFGYASSSVARVASRPWICVASLMLATAPSILAFGAHIQGVGGFPAVAVCAVQAFLVAEYAVSCLAAVTQIHRMTLRQLTAKRELALVAGRDALTGLPNRSQLQGRFARGLAEAGRTGDIVAIHCLDLDQFKAVNDRFGHATGDSLLQAVAERLLRTVRTQDTVARLGGDEFVVIQTGVRDAEQAMLLAERIIRLVGAPYTIEGRLAEIGVSVGIALAPQDGIEFDRLSSRADAALYRAKRGRRGHVFWGEAETCAPVRGAGAEVAASLGERAQALAPVALRRQFAQFRDELAQSMRPAGQDDVGGCHADVGALFEQLDRAVRAFGFIDLEAGIPDRPRDVDADHRFVLDDQLGETGVG